jgi:hypothetical protein
MQKDQLDLPNAVVWIPDSKARNGIAEVPLTPLAIHAFRDQTFRFHHLAPAIRLLQYFRL